MRVTSWQEDKQTWKTAAELPENEANLKGLGFRWAPNLLTGLGNYCFKQQKEGQLFVTEKNNERNEKGLVSDFHKNAKVVLAKSSKHGKTLNSF